MSFSELGFELVEDFLNSDLLSKFQREFGDLQLKNTSGGVRNAEYEFSSVKELIQSDYLVGQAQKRLIGTPQFVRAIVFNKTQSNNWLVSPHQDKTVALSNKLDYENWGPWSLKSGVLHVQPPIEVLESMVTIRIHIDESSEKNGCLCVIPGSHKFGILTKTEILKLSEQTKRELCVGPAGSALIMRPHLVHSSSKGSEPSSRRVLHIDYCSYELPPGTGWVRGV